MIFLKEGETNWKYILIVVILAVLVGEGVLWLTMRQEVLLTQLPEIKRLEKVEDETANWKTYMNEEYGFEIRYPSAILFIPEQVHDAPILQSFSTTNIEGSPADDLAMYVDTIEVSAYKDAQDMVKDLPAYVEGVGPYEEQIDDTLVYVVLNRWYGGLEGVSRKYYFPEFVLCFSFADNIAEGKLESLEEKMLSTFSFILPEEPRNNEDFIKWIKDWQVVKPTYTVDKFTKVDNQPFSLNGKAISTEELEHAMEEIQSRYFPEKRRENVTIYSPNRTKFIFNAGYPDPLEIDQDVVLFDLSTNKYQRLKTCGTACWFEKVFWIDNNQFVVIRTGEYSFTEEYEHSIFLYDLEKNTVMEYKSSEKISTEELKKK